MIFTKRISVERILLVLAVGGVRLFCAEGQTRDQCSPIAALVEKVRTMRESIGDTALALASGVTAENVHDYLPYVDAFLVGTGIESSFGIIDAARLDALVAAMRKPPRRAR